MEWCSVDSDSTRNVRDVVHREESRIDNGKTNTYSHFWSPMFSRKKVYGVRDTIGKGKSCWIQRSRPKPMHHICKEEITKFIEKGVALGLDFRSRKPVDEEGPLNQVSMGEWNLDEEVAKVMETGVALGFDFNALSWNVRGVGMEEKRRMASCVLQSQKSIIFCIQESKLSVCNNRIFRGLGGGLLNSGVAVDTEGSTGGLLSLWNEDLFIVNDCISNKWCLILAGVLNKNDKEVIFCNIYASNLESEKCELWGFILNVQQFFSFMWCIRGDINTILNMSQRHGGVFNRWSAHAFQDFLFQARVVDILIRGVDFTWSNNREKGSWARLDRFLLSPILLS
ncbi:hypothetical protein Ddye_029580 [Dipteronia dyeriana]|uniref:Uncharacterized protein n=1 Tax=Dipteronia dyeriana TaxID=168575 RepID=A0AAD9WLX7_9ROSI|nr:hypothetical protein Ddye_029580 [Dipteronia dyeriana]